MRHMPLLAACAVIALGACDTTDEPHAAGPLAELYDHLAEDALAFGFLDGAWTEDFGDAAAFGPTYYLRAAQLSGDADTLAIAEAARDHNLTVVLQATEDLLWYMDNLEEVFMCVLGLIEYAGLSGEDDLVQAIDAILEVTDVVVATAGDYVEMSVGEFAADLYGPTSATAGIALIYAQYATYLDTADTAHWTARTAELAASVDAQAFDTDHYRFRPEVETLYLYPNATMILVLNRLYELTGEVAYLERAELVYTGIQPLHHVEEGFYQSPYSQAYQGATTDAYSTLSSQNYLSLGLMALHENTGKAVYLQDTLTIQTFVAEHLYDAAEGKLLHHWIDGRPASKDDPDYFCSGCNLQTLYILLYLREEMGVALD